ncbi:hypothetical protein BGW42_001013 [Actinomortierella wolfii]|nr:hypothetical protein BGW42_001013 [Actinomortierella wolfii]
MEPQLNTMSPPPLSTPVSITSEILGDSYHYHYHNGPYHTEKEIFPYYQHQHEQQFQRQQYSHQQPFVDWRAKCQRRVLSERNWATGSIQSACLLSAHRSGIVRLRIKDNKLLSGDMTGKVALWDLTSLQCECFFEAAVGPIQLMDFSAKQMIMTVISGTGICRIWNLETKELIHSEGLSDVSCMTMDDRYLVVGDSTGTIRVIDFTSGELLRSTIIQDQVLQDIYIQNNTMIVVTFNDIQIICLETLKPLAHAKLPTANLIFAYCSVFHTRSLILLIENQLIHMEWDPLYRPLPGASTPSAASTTARNSSDNNSNNNNNNTWMDYELPPDLSRPPRMYRTSVPPIATITSIAIGGKHPHVLTTNADYPSLEDTIRICSKSTRRSVRGHGKNLRRPSSHTSESSSSSFSSYSSMYSTCPSSEADADADDLDNGNSTLSSSSSSSSSSSLSASSESNQTPSTEYTGVVLLHSPVPEVSKFLRECGLKPSFMDVDEDIVVVGTDKGDIVVLNMLQ